MALMRYDETRNQHEYSISLFLGRAPQQDHATQFELCRQLYRVPPCLIRIQQRSNGVFPKCAVELNDIYKFGHPVLNSLDYHFLLSLVLERH